MIRTWIDNIKGLFTIEAKIYSLHHENTEMRVKLVEVKTQLKVIERMLARVIAKADPNYSIDELDKSRKAESDKLAEDVIARMYGEHKASNSFGGK